MSLVAGLILTMMAMQFSYADSRLAKMMVARLWCTKKYAGQDRQVPRVLVLAIAGVDYNIYILYHIKIMIIIMRTHIVF